MSRSARKMFLIAEHAATASLLERLDEGQFIERIGLESRLDEIRDELMRLADVPEPVNATLFFGGKPVVAQEAIEASFAAAAVNSFQTLVEKVGLSRGGLQTKDMRLHITGVARGSFGFEFTQMDEAIVDHDKVKAAIDDTSGVLQNLTADEDAFEQFMTEAEPRVLKSLRGFVEVLANSGAALRFVTRGREVSVSEQQVFRAYAWMEETEPVVEESNVPGELKGFFTTSRKFEYLDTAGMLYRGNLGGLVTDDELARFALKPSIAKLQTTTVARPGRPPRKTYVLMALLSPMETGQP